MQRILLLLSVTLIGGCARLSSSTTGSPETDAAFEKVAQDYIKGFLAWRPQAGTALGFHEYDGRVTDFSRASLDAELARLKEFEKKLSAIQIETLTCRKAYDYRILQGAIRREIFGFEKMQIFSRNPMTYTSLDVNIYIKRNFASLENRVKSIISILNQAPNIMAAARANLEESLPRPQIETAIDEAEGGAKFLAGDLVAALKDFKKEPLLSEFRASNQRAIAELTNYVKFLKEQKLPKANNSYPLGREKYVQLLGSAEMITLSPEELLEAGLRELKHKQQDFVESARMIDPNSKPIDVFKAIQKDHPTEQSLIADTAKNLEMIRQFLIDHHIITLPSPVRAEVKETPQFMRATSFASMDTPGPFEKKATEAYYYVTPVEPDWPAQQKEEWLTAFNYYTTDIVSVHEAYPGHYVQFLCLNASSATPLEKIFGSYAFTEGWAHYAEQMLVDEGFGASRSANPSRDDLVRAAKYRLAQTDEALLRVCRLCVSIKMHCQGMTVDEATKFFQDNCYYEQKPAQQEATRGTYDPEYLLYTVGKLQIFKLREDFRKQEGAKFSLQKFHDEMLRHGAPPIRLLREVMLKDRTIWDKAL
jgi:uncharacterized protein (DUF885 family)